MKFLPSDTPSHRDEPAYFFIFRESDVLAGLNGSEISIPMLPIGKAAAHFPVFIHFIGILDDRDCYCLEAPESYDPETDRELPGLTFRTLRSLFGIMDPGFFTAAGRAVQIVEWDRTHRFCGRCGGETEHASGERARRCRSCGYTAFPRLSPAVITAVLHEDRILLAHNHRFPEGLYSLVAGFVEPGETLEETVHREIAEEVGIRVRNVRYFASQPWPFPHSLMIGFIADYESGEIVVDGEEISDARWFTEKDLPILPPAESIARKIIEWYRAAQRP